MTLAGLQSFFSVTALSKRFILKNPGVTLTTRAGRPNKNVVVYETDGDRAKSHKCPVTYNAEIGSYKLFGDVSCIHPQC